MQHCLYKHIDTTDLSANC